MVLNVHRNHEAYQKRREGGKGGVEVGGEGSLRMMSLSLYPL